VCDSKLILAGSLRVRVPDPAHDGVDQTHLRGQGAVNHGPRGSERKVQRVAAGTARSVGVELLQLVLPSRGRQ
jgi:hypothetical protein